ncbi:MAG: serine hydrolase domain-containing protein, partial [Balneolaceae bacterium]
MKISGYLAFIIVLIATACSESVQKTEAFSFEYAKPESAGFLPDSLSNIAAFIERLVEEEKIPGAVAAITKGGKIVYLKAAGYADIENNVKLKPDHIFRLASMTKPVTSLAIVQLADRGKLSFADPVSKYIPEFSNPEVLESINWNDTTWTTVPSEREVTIHD